MMKNMNIDVIECIEDRESWFNIKRMRIGNLTINRPIKTIDIRQKIL
jgi:hypothetical protein